MGDLASSLRAKAYKKMKEKKVAKREARTEAASKAAESYKSSHTFPTRSSRERENPY